MRILRLDLTAFGPFTDRSLDFGEDGGLHIVQGPNEAGKSSSLRALRNLLYGIPQRCSDSFIHANQNLRIGAVLEAGDGTKLEFIRRKGRTKTLRGPDDAELFDEARLSSLLGDIDETTFAQRFGIDHEELRRGGDSLVRGSGDLGEILFAAGAGVADLRKIQERLETEADALFKPRGSTQRIARAISELTEARKEVRETLLSSSQWTEHDTALHAAERRLREIDEELACRRAERSRLDRVGRSLPLIGRLHPLRAKLAEVADAPLLPEAFSADRHDVEIDLKNANSDKVKAEREIERIEKELRSTAVPTDLLDHRTAISQLHSELGGYRKAAKDRPELIAQRDSARRHAEKLLRELGHSLELDNAESLRLSRTERSRIQALTVDCKALVEKQQACDAAIGKLDEETDRIRDEIARLPPRKDVSDLERTLRQARKYGELDDRQREAQSELHAADERAKVESARLQLFEGTLDELEKLAVPPVETIDRFENEAAHSDQEVRRWKEKCDEFRDACQALQGELDALRLEGEVPTEFDLEHARRRREAGWELIQRKLRNDAQSDDSIAEFIAEFAAADDLETAFRASIDQADAVADRLRREADRVARQAKLTADLERTTSRLADAQAEFEQSAQSRQRTQDAWKAQWEPTGIEPLSPREMRSWRTAQQQLAERTAEIRARRAELDDVTDRIETLRTDLGRCLVALEETPAPHDEPLAVTLDRCEEIVERIRGHEQQRDKLTGELERSTAQRPESKREADDAQRKVEKWREEWTRAVATLGLDGSAEPSEANAVIETVDELLDLLDEARKLDERIDGIDKDADEFKVSVKRSLQQVAPDLLDSLEESIERTVADLLDRLNRAEKNQTKIDGWQEELPKRKQEFADAESRIAQGRKALDKLIAQAGCKSAEELPQAEERSRTRRETRAALQELEQSLCELATGIPFDEWVESVGRYDADRVQADLAGFEDEIERLELEKQEASVAIGTHRNELSRMDGSGKAAEAQLRTEHLSASIRNDAAEYVRVRLAAAVLSRAMERFRESNQGPVLCRASDLFSLLTLGSFSCLRVDYDSQGKAVLIGVRPDGEAVELSGMSDGTCDQLYLALRVALLESALEGRESLPFIVDDILVMFDDDRAAAALRVLARLAEKTQVIFFTHHQHLLDVARETLEGDALHVHRLDAATTATL